MSLRHHFKGAQKLMPNQKAKQFVVRGDNMAITIERRPFWSSTFVGGKFVRVNIIYKGTNSCGASSTILPRCRYVSDPMIPHRVLCTNRISTGDWNAAVEHPTWAFCVAKNWIASQSYSPCCIPRVLPSRFISPVAPTFNSINFGGSWSEKKEVP